MNANITALYESTRHVSTASTSKVRNVQEGNGGGGATEMAPEVISDDATTDAGDEDSPEAETDSVPVQLALDQIFEILKNNRRRLTIHYLNENGGEATLSDVAEHIAALENDTTVKAISSSQRKRVYVGLYQCHLPKMDDMDIVDFDQNRGTIKSGPNLDQLEPYLEVREGDGWHRMYLGLTAAAAGLFLITQLGGATIGLTPAVVLGIFLFGVALCSMLHASGRWHPSFA